MLNVLFTGSIAFIITFLAIPVVIKIAEEKKLFDAPDARKLHKKPIASLGGVGIFCGFFVASLLSVANTAFPEFQYFFAAATIIFFLGLKDDILIITAAKKFIGQLIAAAIIIHLGGIRIDGMHGLFGFAGLSPIFGTMLSYITIILVINAYNLIDGVDGLAGSLGLLTMSVFGAYFYMIGMMPYALLSVAFAGSLLGFLIFNHHPAKIFMGDSGSLLLGMFNAILAIKFINVADTPLVNIPVQSAVAVGIAILMVPLIDTLRVFSIRAFRGRSPFSPDRNHIHHLLLDSGLKHHQVTLCCLLLNILFIVVAYSGRSLGPTYVLLTIAAISLSIIGVLFYFKKSKKLLIENTLKKSSAYTARPVTKVVPLKKDEVMVAEN